MGAFDSVAAVLVRLGLAALALLEDRERAAVEVARERLRRSGGA